MKCSVCHGASSVDTQHLVLRESDVLWSVAIENGMEHILPGSYLGYADAAAGNLVAVDLASDSLLLSS